MYNFDLRTPDSAYNFLLTFFNMSGQEYIEELIINSDNEFEKFWDRNAARVNDISVENIRVWGFHVVGSLDECREIRSQGLRNLQKVLSGDTLLSRILKSNGVFFDVKRHLLFYKGKEYNVDYDWYRNNDYSMSPEKYLKPIAHRVYYDYCVNGFMMNDDIFSYGTNIHERPEFLMKLSAAFPDLKKMEEEWAKRSKGYKVNFYATIDQIHRFNFDLNDTQEELTDEEIVHIKRWMVSRAIDRANNNLISEVFLYIKDEIDIPPEQITSCEEI
ncbi:hypothetical protein DXA30_03520 [Fusobacterium ulcerans]|uniref:hypothetical protein n=1 Tax=Fusobacterium ulcerans TaxID=861 RepID=UPI000E4C039A|nr:hypothetical protein [Fusobacterium ulcerans]RGY66083.1 hypothetical protein DXA30_03520 [Fusobacterium ulcerans]